MRRILGLAILLFALAAPLLLLEDSEASAQTSGDFQFFSDVECYSHSCNPDDVRPGSSQGADPDSLEMYIRAEAQFDSITMSMLNGSTTYGLDTSVSPCQNHFLFVNGGWRDNVELPQSDEPKWQSVTFFRYAHMQMLKRLESILDSAREAYSNTEDHTVKVLGAFYESCMTADSLETNYSRLLNPKAIVRDSSRQQQCLSRVMQYLGGAAGQAFVLDLKTSGAVDRMESLLSSIKKAVRDRISNNMIMSESEKEYALNRLGRLILRVGIPEDLTDYSSLHLLPGDYNENKTLIGNFNNSQWVSSIGSNIREQWKMSLLMANAVYMPGDHAIEIPPLMFSPPFFFREGEDLLNFAGVGYIIGHEIFHSISPQLNVIQSPEMKTEIERLKSFHSSLGELDGWKTDGNRTFNEDVADLGGSRVAYAAWREVIANDPHYVDQVIDGYTPDQRFFIAMGRIWRSKWTKKGIRPGVHGPNFARVNAVAMQNPEFVEAFGCKPEDKMVLPPEKVSKIW